MAVDEEKQFQGRLLLFTRIGIGILFLLFLSIIISRFVFPFSSGTWEAFNWMPATHLLEGKNPYSFAFKPPYGMSPYGIVFYAFQAVGVKLFGFQLWWGKLLSVLAFAACLWSVAKITKKITHSREAELFALLAGLAMFPAQIWIAVVRPDLIAAAFAFAGLWLAISLEKEKKTSYWRVVAIVLLSAAAFFTKQTLLLPFAVIFLRFLQLKKWRAAILFGGAFAALAASGMFLLNYASDGGYVWQHYTHAQRLPFGFDNSVRVFLEMLKHPTFLFSLIFLLVFIYLNRRVFFAPRVTGFLRSPEILIFFYALLSGGWAFLSAGRIGGNANYYLENSLVLAIVGGLIYDNFRRNVRRPRLALAMIVLLTLGGALQMTRVLRGEYFRWQALGYYREIFATAAQAISPGSRCVSVYPELVVWNGCQFNFDDFEEYVGDWAPELNEIFEREVKAGGFAAIIWYDDKLHEKFPNYRLAPMSQSPPEMYSRVYLYVPAASQ
jgi:4-amino-4-deoxy-L-arabinose transferase-like glycosyltransferase